MATVTVLEVESPGSLATVQDLGRPGLGRLGVPRGGALDVYAARAANALAGNAAGYAAGEALIEITLMGFAVRARSAVTVAIAGADLGAEVDNVPVPGWSSFQLAPGTLLRFRRPVRGCRAYLAVGGGVSVPRVLGSRATNLASGFGGHEGRALRRGDVLAAERPEDHLGAAGRLLDPDLRMEYAAPWELRVLPGPQHGDFDEPAWRGFVGGAYTVDPASDRTGVRLSGPAVPRRAGLPESIPSEGVIAGSIQIPGDGRPIVTLAETVTGGYRKIANIVSADLPRLAQAKGGEGVRLREVSRGEALEVLREMEARLRRIELAYPSIA